MQGRGAGRRDGGFGDEAVWLQNNRSNPQIPLVLKTASSDGKQSGSFRFGGLKVVTGAPPPLTARARTQPGNAVSKPSLKLSLPKKAQVKCCEYFNVLLQGLLSQESYSCIQAGRQHW